MVSVNEVTQIMAEKGAYVPGKRVKLDFGEEGQIMLDGIEQVVNNEEREADATIKVALADFVAMSQGKLSGALAFMQGKLKVQGDMGVAMQFQSVTAKMRA